MNELKVNFTYDFDASNVPKMKAIYQSNGWTSHTEDNINTIFKASTHVVIAKVDEKVIGFARALSDGVYNAAIYDVVVDKNYHKYGIGREIVEKLIDRIGEVSCIHLIATTKHTTFYKRIGFRTLTTGMAVYQQERLKNEYTVD
ncbi:GNAT family N-acetyltransferase [Staphylococcus kloosii]|nr:GNAT family N-acetyltransferase [Staphylococcus kloosii]MDT3960090.1 GNAT family N-acetyltransferase [Staphylococcus kloosii]